MSTININLTDLNFHEAGDAADPTARLVAGLTINGVSHHLQAVAVKRDAEGSQVGVNKECEGILADLYVAMPSDTPFYTVEFRGREYAFFMSPSS